MVEKERTRPVGDFLSFRSAFSVSFSINRRSMQSIKQPNPSINKSSSEKKEENWEGRLSYPSSSGKQPLK